jgi:hypothetical protein
MVFGSDKGVGLMRIELGMSVEPMMFGFDRVLDL